MRPHRSPQRRDAQPIFVAQVHPRPLVHESPRTLPCRLCVLLKRLDQYVDISACVHRVQHPYILHVVDVREEVTVDAIELVLPVRGVLRQYGVKALAKIGSDIVDGDDDGEKWSHAPYGIMMIWSVQILSLIS